MTYKEILKMATNNDIMYYLDQVNELNLSIESKCYTIEQEPKKKKEIRKLLSYIQEIMED